jgi:hypothetical protein
LQGKILGDWSKLLGLPIGLSQTPPLDSTAVL